MKKVCRNCGYSTENNEHFCQYCGSVLEDEVSSTSKAGTQICKKCGKEVGLDMDFCPYCGQKINEEEFDNYFEEKETTVQTNYVGYKVCPKCGHEYNRDLPNCPNCNNETYQKDKPKNNGDETFGIVALIFSIIGGWIGLVLSIIGLSKFKSGKTKTLCTISLVISIIWIALEISLFSN